MVWTNPRTGQSSSNIYDASGRILENDQLGKVKFTHLNKIYQPTNVELNATGQQNYTNDLIQYVSYNENNDPVYIDGLNGDVAFQYGLTAMRQRVTYGGNFDYSNQDGRYTKFYSEDGSFEITVDNEAQTEKHVLYIGGNPYNSNIIFTKNASQAQGQYNFLHKDYLGSILAVSDQNGNKIEQRHFDAWGNFTHLKIADGIVITDKHELKQVIANSGGLIVDRGYTGHEHFLEVGIIHMNGRIYDPLLRRFLNADENIQDPFNTQNYNKYGYVMNNPLMFNDPSGEYIFGIGEGFVAAIVIGAMVGTAGYIVGALISGEKITLAGLFKATTFGAISGAVTFGIGSIFTTTAGAATQFATSIGRVGSVFLQATAHGIAQGTLSLMQGGTHQSGMISGFMGSIGASAFGMVAKDFSRSAAGTVLSGAVLGGVGAELTGGNFWQGAVVGGIVAGLNHSLHSTSQKKQFMCVLENDIIDAKLDPNDTNVTGRSGEIMEKVKSIKKIANAITSRKGVIKVTDVTELGSAGLTDTGDFSIQIKTTSINNSTLLGYAYTLGHELIHAFDLQFNLSNWKDDYGNTSSRGSDLHAWRELRAYDWNIRMGMKLQGQQIEVYNGFKTQLDASKTFQNQTPRFRTINPW